MRRQQVGEMGHWTGRRALLAAAMTITSVGAVTATVPRAAAVQPGCVVDLADVLGWWKGEDDLVAEIGPDLTGSVGFGDAHVGRGMVFDHAAETSIADFPAVSDGVTLEAWIRPVRTGFTQALFSRWDFFEGASDDSFALLLTDNGLILYTDEPSLRVPTTVSAEAPELFDGNLHHVAATWGGGEAVLYVDGVVVATAPSRSSVLNASPSIPFRLGSLSGRSRLRYAGVLDEPTVYGRALSAAEIEAIFLAGADGKCPTGWHQQAELTADDRTAADQHGFSVAIDGDTAVVGAPFDDDAGSGSGSAYIYTRVDDVWTQQAKLVSSDGGPGDQFGASVAVSGDTIVVGSYLDDDAGSSSGAAYVFTKVGSDWTEQAKLTASDAAGGDWFGTSVALDTDTAVVGAMFAGGTGAAYAFSRSGTAWSEEGKLVASDGGAGDRLGFDVDVSGDTIVAGAYRDDGAAADTGSAYIFTRSAGTWSEHTKLEAADAASNDWFGYSVAVDGDRVVAGAYRDDDAGSESGSAYVFVRDLAAWTQDAKLTAGDAAAFDTFGAAVDISADTIIVGASLDDDGGPDTGSTYVFNVAAGGWVQQAKLEAQDAAPSDWFGASVAVDSLTAVIGAPLGDAGSDATGSVYVFHQFG